MRRLLPALAVVFLFPPASWAADKPIDFAHDVLPILKARCAECHTAGKYRGGLSLDTRTSFLRSKVIVPGKSASSPLVMRITSRDMKERMPPKGAALTDREVAVLTTWIDQGAPWQEGFSFVKRGGSAPLKLRKVTVPPPAEGRTSSIDRLLAEYRKKSKLADPPIVDDRVFIRRIYLDVVGLLPTPKEVDDFLADTSKDKREHLAHKLLASRQDYAEHWLTFWNDLLRNDYAGTGFIDGGRKPITTWLYKSLLDNKPYDLFVRELIYPIPAAQGFSKGIKWRGVVNASQVVELQFAQNVSQVFLGINMKCASCHDSFIDGWKLDDAYGLAAVVSDRPLEIHRCDKPTGVQAKARFLFPELGDVNPAQPRKERLARLAELLTHPDNGRFSRTIVNRLWHRFFGRGLVHPVDVMDAPAWDVDVLDHLAGHLIDNKYDLTKTIELIVTSRAYQAESVSEPALEDATFRGPLVRRMSAEQLLDAVWRITGTTPAKPAPGFEGRGKAPVRAALVVSDPLMRSLGRPNREQVVSTRPEELSTLQALDLANGQDLAGLLDRGARYLRKHHPGQPPDELIAIIWRLALGRSPTAEEMPAARTLVGKTVSDEGISDLLWAVFLLPEFQLIR